MTPGDIGVTVWGYFFIDVKSCSIKPTNLKQSNNLLWSNKAFKVKIPWMIEEEEDLTPRTKMNTNS